MGGYPLDKDKQLSKTAPLLLYVDKEVHADLADLLNIKNDSIQYLQVHSAAECLTAVMKKNVGLVVVDESLPDLSGLTLVSLLKKMKPEMEIIFTTGCHEAQKEIDVRLLGILYYAVKPLDWSILSQIIERALSKQLTKKLSPSTH